MLRCRRHARAASVADPLPDGLGLRIRKVGATGVEPLVARQLLGPVARQRLEEVLARSRLQEQDVGPDRMRAGVAGGAHDCLELLGPVGDAGQDRRHRDARLDAGLGERARRRRGGCCGRRRAGLGRAPDVARREWGWRASPLPPLAGRASWQHVDVADHHRAAGDQRERVARRRQLRRGTRASAGSGPRTAGRGRWRRRSRSSPASSCGGRARAAAPRRRSP